MNELTRTKAYDTLPENIKPLYSSSKAATINKKLIEKYSISEGNIDTFLDTTGDIILGFHKTSELTGLLQKEVGIGADDAQRIYADLEGFLAPVIAREKGEINPNQVELKELQETFTPAPKEKSGIGQGGGNSAMITDEADPISEEPEAPEHTTVQPMRTMEGDMNRIHGYGAYRTQFPDEAKEVEHVEETIRTASQEELLQEKPKLADMPTYEEEVVEEVSNESKEV